MSEDGQIVGLSVVHATAQYRQEEPFSPHYAGISAVEGLGLDSSLPFEEYE